MKKSDRQNQIIALMYDAPPEEVVTTRHMAEALQVSEATIRRDFQELAEAGKIQRHHGGAQTIRPDHMLSNVQHGQVGILLASRIDKYSDPFYNLVLQGADRKLGEHGYHVAYIKTFYDVQTALQAQDLLDTFDIDGLILLGTTRDESIHYLRKHFNPIVTVTDVVGARDDTITFDGEYGMKVIVEHLATEGYRQLGYISGYKDSRYVGFIDGLATFGLVDDPRLHQIIVPNATGWTPSLGEKGAANLMSSELKPDAIVCASDRLAIGAMRWLQQNGYDIPKDIAVTGFDDIPDSAFTFPPLTTVQVHKSLLGELAAERIVRRIANSDEVSLRIITPTEIVVRQSSVRKS